MIIDNIIFFNELDLLEIRLDHLYDKVDKFIIIECEYTFSNLYKGLILKDNLDRFEKYKNKIQYEVYKSTLNSNPWYNEYHQRNYIYDILKDKIKADDILIFTDLDQIPSHSAIDEYKNIYDIRSLEQIFCCYYINLSEDRLWTGGKILRGKHMVQDMNSIRQNIYPVLHHAGHHISYLGGLDKITTKIKSFSHQELNNNEFLSKLPNFFNEEKNFANNKFYEITIDNTFPKIIQNNINKYKSIGYLK